MFKDTLDGQTNSFQAQVNEELPTYEQLQKRITELELSNDAKIEELHAAEIAYGELQLELAALREQEHYLMVSRERSNHDR